MFVVTLLFLFLARKIFLRKKKKRNYSGKKSDTCASVFLLQRDYSLRYICRTKRVLLRPYSRIIILFFVAQFSPNILQFLNDIFVHEIKRNDEEDNANNQRTVCLPKGERERGFQSLNSNFLIAKFTWYDESSLIKKVDR